jgi:hypothetical protein
MNLRIALVSVAVLAAASTPATTSANRIRPAEYGQWRVVCGTDVGPVQTSYCGVRFQVPGEELGWEARIKATEMTQIITWGLAGNCRNAELRQEEGRPYSLRAPNLNSAAMQAFARQLLAAMHLSLDFFRDCYNDTGRPRPYPANLLDDNAADFTRAVVAVETNMRTSAQRAAPAGGGE